VGADVVVFHGVGRQVDDRDPVAVDQGHIQLGAVGAERHSAATPADTDGLLVAAVEVGDHDAVGVLSAAEVDAAARLVDQQVAEPRQRDLHVQA
jgi:hypothetical protein